MGATNEVLRGPVSRLAVRALVKVHELDNYMKES